MADDRTTTKKRETKRREVPSAARLDRSLNVFMRDALRLSLHEPRRAAFFAKTVLNQPRAAARRRVWAERGVAVPPMMVVSVTRTCNLRCAGCFVQARSDAASRPMDSEELRRLLREARHLGVSVVALAGGEPLTRPEILAMVAENPELVFVMVTNGSLLDEPTLDRMELLRNLIPVVSLEGFEAETDGRRGAGVFSRAVSGMERMRKRRMLFGASIMVTRTNFALVTSRLFVRRLVQEGSRVFFYVDYVPVEPDTEHLVPSRTQRRSEALSMSLFRSEFPGIFLAPSAGQEQFGGCLAAGNGFVHVSAEGALEPCPFAPFSDANVRDVSLRDALCSPFLRRIRESDVHLTESDGGCALRAKREWLESLRDGSDDDPSDEPVERLVA